MGRPGRLPQGQVQAVRDRIRSLLLAGLHPSAIAKQVELAEDTVRRHLTVIRQEWKEQGLDVSGTRLELIAKANSISQQAAIEAAKARGTSAAVAALKLQLEVVDRIAKLTGAYAPEKAEISGPGGGAIQVVQTEHEIDKLPPAQVAARLRAWAEDIESQKTGEEVQDEQPGVPRLVEAESTDV